MQLRRSSGSRATVWWTGRPLRSLFCRTKFHPWLRRRFAFSSKWLRNSFRRTDMPVVPTTAYSQAEDALSLARALLNDSAGAVFTDTLLMPLLNSAYRGLQRELAENGISVMAEQQDIELDIDPITGATNAEISDVSSPQLPTDCLMPH